MAMRKLPKYKIIDDIECLECVNCGEMKPSEEFRQYRSKCKKCEREENNARNKLAKDNIVQKQRERRSTPEGKAKVKEYNAKRCATEEGRAIISQQNKIRSSKPESKIKRKEYRKRPDVKAKEREYQNEYQRILRNKPGYKEWMKAYKYNRRNDPSTREKVREQEMIYLHRRRGLGYIPINDYFKGSHRHHLQINEYGDIDKDTVLRIPIKEHKSTHHDRSTGKGMIEINEFCLSWYIDTYQKGKPYNEEVEINVFKLRKIVEFTKKEVENGWRNRYEY